jgi:hypothetical protein
MLITLPTHVLIEITSYLDQPSLKNTALVHPILKGVVDIHLFRTISIPFRNTYYPVQNENNIITLRPHRPHLAASLESLGWKEDYHESNHLDASFQYFIPLLKGREGYVKEIKMDLKDRYHDMDLDLDTYAYNSSQYQSTYPDYRLDRDRDEGTETEKGDDLDEFERIRYHLSTLRRDESPSSLPRLCHTFSSIPVLPSLFKLDLTIYESFQGFLPHLFPLVPKLQELVIRPHHLLVESPLDFSGDCGIRPRGLRRLRVEPMCDTVKGLVGALLEGGIVEHLELVGEGWKLDGQLAEVIGSCPSLKSVRVGKKASKALSKMRTVWEMDILP